MNEDTREQIARVLGMVAEDGLPNPRDLDVALDAIEAAFDCETDEESLRELKAARSAKECIEQDRDHILAQLREIESRTPGSGGDYPEIDRLIDFESFVLLYRNPFKSFSAIRITDRDVLATLSSYLESEDSDREVVTDDFSALKVLRRLADKVLKLGFYSPRNDETKGGS